MNSGILRSIFRRSQTMSKCVQASQFHTTKLLLFPPSKSKKSDVESNPFGLNDDKDIGSLLVQGNLDVEDRPKSEDTEVDLRLQKYESWVKQSQDPKKNFSSDAEAFRVSRYGNVRLDRENVAKEIKLEKNDNYELNPMKGRRSRKEYVQRDEEEGRTGRMTAYQFLKEQKLEEREIAKATENKTREFEMNDVAEYVDYEKNTPPENSSSYEYLDSNTIPKQYMLPDLNTFTHGDMWHMLKKSIIFENDFVMAINKPLGIAFQGESRDCRHFILQFLKEFAEHCKCPEIFPLHRIDKDTTGVLVFAKDKRVANVMSQKFAQRQVKKLYLAVTKSCPHIPVGTINIPIGEGKIGATNDFRATLRPDLRDYKVKSSQKNRREAITKFRVLVSREDYAFLELQPESGVKHQIRVHLGLGLGCPILGDHKYSHRDRLAPQRLSPAMLHKLKVKQTKVRELPIHLHCSQIMFDLSSELTESKEPLFIHAKVPYFFSHTLKALGLARYKR